MRYVYPPLIERREVAAVGAPNVVIVCEHATNHVPPEFGDLGLDGDTWLSHIAWDPGALGLAREIRLRLNADLVAASVSRLLYDCNRPPEAPSAIPELSELFQIPGNQRLNSADRAVREEAIYKPFHAAVNELLDERGFGIFVTIHSFTSVFYGSRRTEEVGILHDIDAGLANTILGRLSPAFPFRVDLNAPYSMKDGVTHTLKKHGVKRGWPNAMIEVRNDLLQTPEDRGNMGFHISNLLSETIRYWQAGQKTHGT